MSLPKYKLDIIADFLINNDMSDDDEMVDFFIDHNIPDNYIDEAVALRPVVMVTPMVTNVVLVDDKLELEVFVPNFS